MMGTLNISSLILVVGAIGQYWFYSRVFSSIAEWIVLGVLFVPWLTVFVITFCKRPPFGPHPFRICLLFVMGLYALLTISAEILDSLLHLPPDGHFSATAARIMMYAGFLCFIPFIRAYHLLRRNESAQAASGNPPAQESPTDN